MTTNLSLEGQEPPGWICPNCKHESVLIQSLTWVRVDTNGAWPDEDEGGFGWEDNAPAKCPECDWKGTANDCAVAAEVMYPQLKGGTNGTS